MVVDKPVWPKGAVGASLRARDWSAGASVRSCSHSLLAVRLAVVIVLEMMVKVPVAVTGVDLEI